MAGKDSVDLLRDDALGIVVENDFPYDRVLYLAIKS